MSTAKITSKGQITIPRSIRKALSSDIVEFEITKGYIIIKPVKSVAGSLKKYSKRPVSPDKIREHVWNKVAKERGRS